MKYLIIISSLFLYSSCSEQVSTVQDKNELLIGEWRLVEVSTPSEEQLKTEEELKDGLVAFTKDSLYLYSGDKTDVKTTWEIKGDTIFVEITNDPQAWVSHIPFIIKEISSNYLEVQNTQKPISTIKLKKK